MKQLKEHLKELQNILVKFFTELTSGGKANLVMQKPKGVEELEGVHRVQTYRGVDIQVAFNETAEFQQMGQLSGGQQSLVALSLIFAIQRCDPAPFYVFDEIDPALDDNYRLAVAKNDSKTIKINSIYKCYSSS